MYNLARPRAIRDGANVDVNALMGQLPGRHRRLLTDSCPKSVLLSRNRPIARGRFMVWRQREYPGRLPNQGSRAPWSAPGACYGRLHGGNTPRNGGNLLVDRATTRQFETSCATKMATNSTADIITEPCMRLRILENLIMIANTTTFEFTTSSGKTTLRDPPGRSS